MKLIGLIRLGRDAEIRYTGDGKPVASLAGAWNHGRKGDDGKRPTQWADLALWGDRAEKLQEYLTKGKQVFVVCSDVHVQTYQKNDGSTGVRLVGRVDDIEFAGGQNEQAGQQGQQRQAAPAQRQAAPMQQRQAPAPKTSGGGGSTGTAFDDLDDDIPFVSAHAEHDPMLNDSKGRRTRRAR